MYKNYTQEPGMPVGYIHKFLLVINLARLTNAAGRRKIIMRINLTTLVLIAAIVQVSAAAYAQRITLKEKGVTLENVFKEIHDQSGYDFFFNRNIFQKAKPVTIELKNLSLSDALNACLAGQPFSYVIDNKTIVIKEKLPARQLVSPIAGVPVPPVKITGVIKDTLGITMPEVSVINKTTGQGAVADLNGAFKIDASPGDILVFSFIGYTKTQVTVGTETKLTIVLKPEINKLNDVVVTALGIAKDARKIGYAVTKVDGNLLNQAIEPNVANSLTGRVSGLDVSGTNGGPGSSARLLIRGITNFTSTTGPLFVIDGVPMDNTQKGSAGVYGGADMGDGISSINPDDIENVVVLKGSTASALYGTRASNGVILVTTKSGKGAKGFGVEYSANYSVNSIIDNTDYQKVYGAGVNGQRPQTQADLVNDGLNSWGGILDGSPSIEMDGKMHPYSPVQGQLGDFYRVAPVINNTVSLVNGGDNGNMRLSISQYDDQSVIPNSGLKRYTGNLNINQNITGHLKLILMANFINEDVKNRPFLDDKSRNPNFTMLQLPANINPVYLKPGYSSTGSELALSADGYTPNPWFAADEDITNTSRNRIITSTALRYDILKGLYVQTRLGLDHIEDGLFEVEPTGQGYLPQGALDDQTKAQTTELNFDVLSGYSRNFAKNLDLDASLGGNIRKYQYEDLGTSGTTFNIPYLYTVSNLNLTTPVYDYSEEQTNSAYYTMDFSYKRWLTLSTTGREDVFSTLPAGSRSIFTPSVSSSFVFSDLVHVPELNYGKLRLSYAQTSGEANPYETSVYYQVQPGTNNGIPFGNTLTQTYNVADLKPYRMKEFEAGLELKWFNSRLGLDADYFNRRTKDELISESISYASGYQTAYEPLGSTANNGIELTLNGTPVKTDHFVWNSSFNFTLVNNKLVSIDGKQTMVTQYSAGLGQYRPAVGPYNNGAGLAQIVGLPLEQVMAYDYKYDAKGNIVMQGGIPERGNLTPVGSGLPKYYGGFNNDFAWKQFDLSFLLDYRFGCKVLSGTDWFSIYDGLNKSTLPGRESGVLAKGVNEDGTPNTTVVSAEKYYQGLVTNVTTPTVFDGSFIKLRQVTFGYKFNDGFLQHTPFTGLTVALAARNLVTLLKHTQNFDPEDNFSSLPGNAGLEGGGLPDVRTYGISLNVKLKK
jgi:TonB-linked SusC/RagA family outer membrane protein